MTEEQPMFLTNLCYTFAEFRRELGGLVCAEGVSGSGSLKVTTGGSGLDLSVAAGGAFIQGDDAADQGIYWVRNGAAVTLTATAADATNPRIDTVVATVRDSDYGGTDDDWVLQILPGTPTGGANLTNLTGAAALPNDSIRLAYVLVPATFAGPFVDATHILDARSQFLACGDRYSRSTVFTKSSNQSFTTGATTVVTYPAGATGSALGNDWLTESSGTVTVKRAGVYLVVGNATWAANADANRRRIQLNVNNSSTGHNAVSSGALNSGSLQTQQGVSEVMSLAVGDTVAMAGSQSSGGNLNMEAASLTITRLGTLFP